MPVSVQSRFKLPAVERTLQPPSPHQLLTQKLVEEGRRERQARAMAARRRELGMEEERVLKFIG